MISKNEIDYWIDQLLDFLEEIQNLDGSFDTMYLQPYYNKDKGWMKYPGNSPYETAFPLIILSDLTSEKAKNITDKGITYIKKKSLDNFLWTYAFPSKKDLVPYDTDSTSLCSYVLEKQGEIIDNKAFLNELINEKGYYPFYIWPAKRGENIKLWTYLRLKWWNYKTKNSTNITRKILQLSDSEFTSTCINLLYLGRAKENEIAWQTIEKKVNNKEIDFLYYIDLFHAIYHYSRLIKYEGNLNEHENLNHYIDKLHEQINEPSFSLRSILFLNTILLSDGEIEKFQKNIEVVFKDLKQAKYKRQTSFYSSNVKTDFQPGTKLPNTYFGSPAITCSLYIEFLNLYKKKYYGE